MNRERCFIDYNFSPEAVDSGDSKMLEYIEKQCLSKIGFLYAEKYATKKTLYRMVNRITNDSYLSESKELINDDWVINSVVIRYTL